MQHMDWDQHHAATPHGHGGGGRESAAELAGFLAGLTEPPRRALDLGCGTGADAVFLAEQGIHAAGLDASSTALEHARARAEQHGVVVDWILGDVLHLPLEDGSVDLVLDRGCLHHVADADQSRYAAEVARVLRPGGTLLVREMNQPGHHEHAVSEHSLHAMVEGTPLRVRSIVTYAGSMLAVLGRD
jgi:ubiquinone/menaquinone biosynthesis C-methylase UbiE